MGSGDRGRDRPRVPQDAPDVPDESPGPGLRFPPEGLDDRALDVEGGVTLVANPGDDLEPDDLRQGVIPRVGGGDPLDGPSCDLVGIRSGRGSNLIKLSLRTLN
jgi:hypothetical protein